MYLVYRRPESNRHALAGTGFWVQRVYQFRHAGIWTTFFHLFEHKAVTGFEPVMKVLQTSALPLGYTAIFLVEWFIQLNWASWIRTNAWGSQSPLPYRLAIAHEKKRRLMGIEPTHAGTTIRCVNHFTTIAMVIIFFAHLTLKMAGVVGIEPTLMVLETIVLPLNYTPIL